MENLTTSTRTQTVNVTFTEQCVEVLICARIEGDSVVALLFAIDADGNELAWISPAYCNSNLRSDFGLSTEIDAELEALGEDLPF